MIGLYENHPKNSGALFLALCAKSALKLSVPSGSEKESALILAKPGREECGIYPGGLLEEVVEFFQGKRKLEARMMRHRRSSGETHDVAFSAPDRTSEIMHDVLGIQNGLSETEARHGSFAPRPCRHPQSG
jgi:hypothetical protein